MLRLPQGAARNFLKLAELTDDVVNRLCSALSALPVSLDQGAKIYSVVVEDLRSDFASDDAAKEIAQTLQALYFVYARSGNSKPAEFIEELTSAIVGGAKAADVSPQRKANLNSTLVRLLSIRPLLASHKAALLRLEHQHIFASARIITDVRPVFGEQMDELAATVLFHTLKLTYWDSGRQEEIYVAMDSEDLKALREVVDRGIDKAKRLRAAIHPHLSPNVFDPGSE